MYNRFQSSVIVQLKRLQKSDAHDSWFATALTYIPINMWSIDDSVVKIASHTSLQYICFGRKKYNLLLLN